MAKMDGVAKPAKIEVVDDVPDDLKAVKLASWIELSHKNLSKLLKTTFGFDIKEFNK
jgi:hypothetical protein